MIDDIKPYSDYKESGFPLLGRIPAHWRASPLGRIGCFSKGNGGSKADEVSTGVPCVRYGDLYMRHEFFIRSTRSFVTKEKSANYTRLQYGDVLFAASGELIEDIGRSAVNLIDGSACCGGDIIIYRTSEALPEFLGYACDAPPTKWQKARMGRGFTVVHIYASALKHLVIGIPPTSEQDAIVRFLNGANTRIQNYIHAKRNLIKLLNEERQAIIQRAVTRGVNNNVTLKSSNTPWLGDIPQHWDVVRSRRLFTVRKELARPEDVQLSATQAYGVIPQSEFEQRVRRRVVKISMHLDKRRHVERDDFVISMRSFQGGLERAWASGAIRSSYVILKPERTVNIDFFSYLFKSRGYISALQATADFIRDGQDLTYDNFRRVDLPLIPLDEQRTIAKEIADATSEVDAGITRLRTELDLLREYRTRLIADVVTGQLDVRAAATRFGDMRADRHEVSGADGEAPEEGEVVFAEATYACEEALERLEKRTPLPHYFGAIIYSEPQSQTFGTVPSRFLVDGQQRITTFQLVLAAIKEVARVNKVGRLVSAIDAYLFNEKTASMADPARERFKLWPSSYDRTLFQHIAENPRDKLRSLQSKFFYKNGNLIKGSAPNLLRAYWFLLEVFEEFIAERGKDNAETPEVVLDALLGGFLSGFQIVVIQLDQNDDAQEIFASLNGLSKPLSPFDLIRNDVFHRARKHGEDEQQLFDGRWKNFEKPFWTEQVRQGRLKRARADHLVAHAVVAETAREVNVGKIAVEYQRYSRERASPTVAEELDVLLTHAETYAAMESGKTGGPLGRVSEVLRIWDLSTFHPLILHINAHSMGDPQKERLFRLLENYIIRREICALTTKNYNKVVLSMVRQLSEGADPVADFQKHLSELKGDASRMPTDVQIVEAVSRYPAYSNIPAPRLKYILQNIEYGKRTKFDEVTVVSTTLTIEHVMPRKWSKHWPLPNGFLAPVESTFEATIGGHQLSDEVKSLMETRQRLVNTIGNLTLLTEALNPSVGNGPWLAKREKFAKSLLALNRDVAAIDAWGETSIEARANDLAAVANRLWPAA
jgi:Protein of unknown function (DUF1524)/Protein of unknown function DUF262